MGKNISTKTTAERLAGLLNQFYAKKTDLPTKLSDLTNDGGFISETTIDEKISAAVAGALIPGGSVTFANLPALTKANNNHIYNIEDAFTTTADFVEGAGKEFPAGTNVAIINTGTASSPVYKYDTYTGTFDFSGFANKVSGATSGHLAALDANGDLTDSGKSAGDFTEKVVPAAAGNLAGLAADGSLQDSGKAAADVQVKTVPAAAGNLASLDAQGVLQDSGKKAGDFVEKVFIEGTEDPVLHESDITDYTEAELRTLLGLPAAE